VGMAYAGEDIARTEGSHRAYLSRELANFHLARLWIIEHASVDQSRFFMAGISRGGWLTSMLCDLEMRDLAGIAVLLAGRLRSATPVAGELFKGNPCISAWETRIPTFFHPCKAANSTDGAAQH